MTKNQEDILKTLNQLEAKILTTPLTDYSYSIIEDHLKTIEEIIIAGGI